MTPTRRDVLKAGASGLAGTLLARLSSGSAGAKPVRFGVITDVHHGLAKRTEQRLEEFLVECEKRELDFIIQMGDFNHPVPEAEGFLKLWHSHKGKRYGVLGNHDMDMGSKAQALENWRLKSRFYSFDSGFLHFVVLDANFFRPKLAGGGDGEFVPYEKGNWYRSGITASWIDPEQIDWLRADLAATKKPTVIFVHQPLDDIWEGGSVPNRAEVRRVFEESGKVVAVLQGHDHQDASEMRNGILYWRVNSASYAWVGENYGRMADYDRSLFAFVEIGDGAMGDTRYAMGGESQSAPEADRASRIPHRVNFVAEGRRGIFEGDSPFTRGVPNFDRFSPNITSLRASLAER